jgi:hypothetical protein
VTLPVPEPGLVIGYSYLWRSDYERGQEEGTKDRPCVLVLAVKDEEGEVIVTVVPVTHAPPERPDEAVEIPQQTKRRLGLDSERSWIIASEVNRFAWPGPDLRPVSRAADRFDYGVLPPSLFRQVKERLAVCAQKQRLKAVPRTE